MASVLLCTDEPILSEGLTRILSTVEDLTMCAYCPRIEDLKVQLEAHQPDILLMGLSTDITFGVLSNLQGSASDAKIVLWVHSISTELALQAMSLGVRGILRKTLSPETLLRSLGRINEGELWFDKTLTDSIMTARRYSLTRREGQLVSLLSQGLKNKEIATALCISEGTVKVYLSRLFQKLGVKDRLELALYGLRNLTPVSPALERGDADPRQSNTPVWQPPRSFFVERVPQRAQSMEAPNFKF